jgi:beta-lactam-binding protein with PASTA domain
VTFSSATSGVCTVSGSTVSFVGAGMCTLDANQAGNSDYTPAPTATQSFTVAASKTKQELCVVPKLKGKRLAAARRALKKAHCAVGHITKRKSSTVRKGRVISSRPKAASRHQTGTRVALTVSRGKH